MDQSPPLNAAPKQPKSEKLRDHARKCRSLAAKVIPQEVAERLKAFARIYEERATELEGRARKLVEPAHYPAHEGSGGRA
jgi:hypothetical protein